MTMAAECPRALAEATLGVRRNATLTEIRKAWKERAFELHPDRGVGSSEQFAEVNNAYSYLCDTPAEPVAAVRPARPAAPANDTPTEPTAPGMRPRPAARERTVELSETAAAQCHDLLSETAPANTDAAITDHVPGEMRRTGRRISYRVNAQMGAGLNRIAVPTGALVDGRKVLPALVEVTADETGASVFSVPEDILKSSFPGAKSVRIHFADNAW